MMNSMVHFFLAACFAAVHLTLAAELGVGFSLSIDYRYVYGKGVLL